MNRWDRRATYSLYAGQRSEGSIKARSLLEAVQTAVGFYGPPAGISAARVELDEQKQIATFVGKRNLTYYVRLLCEAPSSFL